MRPACGAGMALLVLGLGMALPMSAMAETAQGIRVLILSGQNNHDWRTTTPWMKQVLESSVHFSVDVTEKPEEGTAEQLDRYDVLLSNWNGWGKGVKVTEWPQAMRDAFLDFVRNGKGLVVVHAGSSSFYDWPEYHQLTGATWKVGQTGHGPVHEFEVKITDTEHPITKGMTDFRTTDELWHRAGVQPGAKTLATAFSAKDKGGTGQDEPVALITEFGKGRGFNLVLGHNVKAMQTPSWQALLLRGTEWAATGAVKRTATSP